MLRQYYAVTLFQPLFHFGKLAVVQADAHPACFKLFAVHHLHLITIFTLLFTKGGHRHAQGIFHLFGDNKDLSGHRGAQQTFAVGNGKHAAVIHRRSLLIGRA
ncbi:hypothetical protein D3C81_1946930 [compost metagenome]